MANQQMTEAERQFQADLEKATALSMESLALDEFRRKKRTSVPTPATVKLTHEDVGQKSLQEYRNYLMQRTMSLNETARPSLSVSPAAPNPIAPPPALPTRRNSVQHNRDEPAFDLISFTPATTQQVSEQESQHANFVQLVDNMHKMNAQLQETRALVPMRSNSGHTSPYPSYMPTHSNPSAMQLVPYVPAATDKPVPLTPDQLNKLYSMNKPSPYAGTAAAPIPNYSSYPIPPSIGFNVPQNYRPTHYVPPPQQPPPIYYPNAAAAAAPIYGPPPTPQISFMPNQQQLASHTPMLQPPLPFTRDFQTPSPNQTAKPFDLASLALPKSKSEVALRKKSESGRKVTSNDLIDLDNDDKYDRVSVLEAFDPLLIGNRSSSEDDKDDNASSYYSEYDPFDYIYSGGTQYSDPVYDAINRSTTYDKQLISPPDGPPPPPPIGFYLPDVSEPHRAAPPLPPRNHSIPNREAGLYERNDRKRVLTKLYEDVVVKRTYDAELVAFYEMVKALRGDYAHSDVETNVGHVVAAELENRYPTGTSIKLMVHPMIECLKVGAQAPCGSIEGYGAPVAFTCDITTTVEHVLSQAFCKLEDLLAGNPSDYLLKTIGVQEFLSPQTRLNHLEFIHNSIKLEKDVQLSLCPRSDKYLKVIARTARDDIRDSELKLEDILPKEPTSTIGYDNLMILLETLEMEIERLESSADTVNPHVVLSCSGVVQGVKAICALLGSIDTLEVADSIGKLRGVCSNGEYRCKETPVYGESKLDIVAEVGDYAEVKLRPKTMNEHVRSHCNQVRNAVRNLLEIYAQAFRVNFRVDRPDWTTIPISTVNISQGVMVHILCLHRPPPTWRHDEYLLGAQIYHGTRYISEAVVTRCSNEVSGLYPRYKFDSWIHFENMQLCTLPREARLIFVLYGCTIEPADGTDANQASSATPAVTKIELGWSSIQFFDYERLMVQGSYLLSLWPPTNDKYFGIAPAKGTHPYGHNAPVLGIEFPDYMGSVKFPEPIQNVPEAPRLDFHSLDSNLQQELIDTAEQGYPLDKLDKREVLWEKRYYLQSFPNALPKVLHAAHSWDFACLADLHALIRSWAPLSPMQALELLLPRYPDLEVRSQAVKWISKMPNDQLVDFLPQLLQALKNDTYETSALARFLLARALESPRVAHHLYWLLVHSIPGEAPQNNIELTQATQMDELLMTQARYHRRSQLMLRSLLAICGEKLTARFMAQNMICKALADTAQSVKNVKESLRLQTLKQGLEVVNQILMENPTTLPLGPGLEVSGVQTRSSNYFNSNTLPLKINFFGPDKSILPAIFKAGDDLQQDMLTIQMVRIMDKLWLCEGLDLKIVTFNCIPTGDKKGMIEMVSDAETLRKIQVEWGLTGSFKDKPIAEWLARQNPSQLEYQRAVDNFTVSCAGYSVATYILGICDRHNDNIMLKTSGHLFHIDFGKFLGDAQMFGNFKRDRTPFVLTSDMAYVINGGDRPSSKFHHFVDLCCQAFNIVRKHGDLLLHMFALMATSGIPGVTADAVTYVRAALLPGQSNPEAAASFAKMIHVSLKSWFTQFNFFLHNLAQMRFTAENGDGELLSFVPRIYNMREDGRLKSVTVHGAQKRYDVEKYYTFILKVTRQAQPDPAYLFRSYKEFCEFHQKLCLHFPLARLHGLPTGMHVGRSNIKTVADKRLPEIQKFLMSLFNSADEIAHSDLVYTFFHPLLRDQQEADIHVAKVRETRPLAIPSATDQMSGELKLSLQYHRGALTLMVHHAKALPTTTSGQEPNTYVKVYLKPDKQKATKRKTKVVRKNCYPSFMETLEYRLPLDYIRQKTLQVTVWSHDSLQENEFLGGVELPLGNYDLRQEIIRWFPLVHLPRT